MEYLRLRHIGKVDAQETVAKKFHSEIAEDTVRIQKGFSWEVLDTFPNHYFDWVYLDAAHGL